MKATRAHENYIEIKRQILAEGRRFVLVSVQEQRSFDPSIGDDLLFREGRLIVDASGTLHGTASNPELDKRIREQARLCLAMKKGEELTIGSAKVAFEYMGPSPKLVIIGAGAVGRAIARAAAGLDFKVILVDDGDGEWAGQGIEHRAVSSTLESIQFDEETYIVIAHPLDYLRALFNCLDMPWAYFGVLGSKAKIEELWKNFCSRGVSDTMRAKIHAPLGFDIGARTPEEIAIAALAEILAVKNGKLPKAVSSE